MNKFWALFLFPVFLSSCATEYQSRSFTGGYSELKLANDSYLISFRGNGFTSSERAHTFAIRRAAELTKEKGFKYFLIQGSKDNISTSAYRTPVTAHSNYNVYSNGSYGNSYGNSDTTITGGDVVVTERPTSIIQVKMFHKKVSNSLNAEIFLGNFENK